MQNLFHYFLLLVAGASLGLVALSYLEGAIAIWIPRTPRSGFWSFYDRLLLTLRYVSASEEKLALSRFLRRKVAGDGSESE